MTHVFNVEVAVECGINAAIIFQNIGYWCAHSKANGTNAHDGRYWTFNSIKAMRELFPYMTEKQIRKAIDVLLNKDMIVKGNYNERAYDRTIWYALSEKGELMFYRGAKPFALQDKTICPTGQMELPLRANQYHI